ncbi:hypothetical protein WJX81_000252 [Elliptochloris bilobata]|uniref:DCD domain-containing protein n=1 Tax=Elliptochloris bilobata TaxID=381761 RepID=A0AAW1SIR7_9CHLO
MGAGRKTQTYDVDSQGGHGQRNFEDNQRNLGDELGGCIFGCTKETYEECVTELVFGLPKAHWCYVSWIAAGIPIFLFSYSDRKLHGIFRSVTDGALNINPRGWCCGGQTRTQYPAQVQVEWYRKCEPLVPAEYQPIIRNCYYEYEGGRKDAANGGMDAGAAPEPSGMSADDFPALGGPAKGTAWSKPLIRPNSSSSAASKAAAGAGALTSAAAGSAPAKGNGKAAVRNAKKAHAAPGGAAAAPEQRGAAGTGAAAASAATRPTAVAAKPAAGPADDVEAPGTPTTQRGEAKAGGAAAWGAEEARAGTQSASTAGSNASGEEFFCDPGALEVAGAGPVPSAEEVTSSLTAAHAAVANVDVEAADALWHALTDMVALLDRARAERLSIARVINRLQTENAAMKAEVIALRRDTAAIGRVAGVAVSPVSSLTAVNGPTAPGQEMWLLGGNNGAWMNTMEVWAPKRKLAVAYAATMPNARGYGGAAAIGREIYTVGGGNGINWYRSAHKYQVDTKEWFEMAPMGSIRGSPAAVALNGKLFVMGGGEVGVHLASTEVLEPELNAWLAGPTLSCKRFATAAAALNGAIYIAGGYDGSQYLTSAEMLDPRVGKWKRMADMKIKRGSQAMTAVNGQILAVGGWDSSAFLNSVEAFDPRKGVWREVASMAAGRAYGAAAALDGVVYAIGGMRGQEHNELVERYDRGADAWVAVELAPGAEPFKCAFMSCCVL